MFSFVSNGFQNLSATPRGTVAARLGIISGRPNPQLTTLQLQRLPQDAPNSLRARGRVAPFLFLQYITRMLWRSSRSRPMNAPYRSGPSRTWIKDQESEGAPAATRIIDGTF
jgi:hypothetical protein